MSDKVKSTVQMGPKRLLELIQIGIRNGRYEATIDLINDVLAQLPEDTEFSSETKAHE